MRQTVIATVLVLAACGGQSNVTPPPKETPTTSGSGSSTAATPAAKGPPRAIAAPDVGELGKLLRAEGGLKHVNARVVDESCPKKIWDKKKGTSPVGVEELHDGPDTYASLSGTSEDSSRDQMLAWAELVPEDRFLGVYAPSLAGQKFWTGICVERDKILEAGVHFERLRKKDKSFVDKDVPIEFLPKMAEAIGKLPKGTMRVAFFYDDYLLAPLMVSGAKPGNAMRLIVEP